MNSSYGNYGTRPDLGAGCTEFGREIADSCCLTNYNYGGCEQNCNQSMIPGYVATMESDLAPFLGHYDPSCCRSVDFEGEPSDVGGIWEATYPKTFLDRRAFHLDSEQENILVVRPPFGLESAELTLPRRETQPWQLLDNISLASPGTTDQSTTRQSSPAFDILSSFQQVSGERSCPQGYDFDPTLHQQSPRFDGDLYTTGFVRGRGRDRSGWCGYCSCWFRLKDSAYWYHVHYTHGISCATGLPFPPPEGQRKPRACDDWEVLCGGCKRWITVGKGEDRSRTAYFRHAYRCQNKGRRPFGRRINAQAKGRSPRKPRSESAALPSPVIYY